MKTSNDKKDLLLTCIIAESEIECIPPSIHHHPQIKSYVKNRNKPACKLLLDASYHHAAMKKLPEGLRRGRPDIIHRCALFALDSSLNKQGLLRIIIHTRNDYVIRINPKTRLPRQYNRFVGLIEQLLEKKRITSSQYVLLEYEQKSLSELSDEFDSIVFLLSEDGKKINLFETINDHIDHPMTFVIGGFPHGDFHQAHQLINKKISFASGSFTASYILAQTICTFENVLLNHFK